MRGRFRPGWVIAAMLMIAAPLTLAGCGRPAGSREDASAGNVVPGNIVGGAEIPTGDLAGAAQSPGLARIDNPLKGQPAAVAEGRRLFEQMNCAGCHGYDLGGGTMAPNLTDRYWRYGGTPGAIYQSIANGRPLGMPAWRTALPPADIWRLVSYIEAQGATTPPADYQAGEQGDLAALPVTPAASPAPAPAPRRRPRSAHP